MWAGLNEWVVDGAYCGSSGKACLAQRYSEKSERTDKFLAKLAIEPKLGQHCWHRAMLFARRQLTCQLCQLSRRLTRLAYGALQG